MFIPTLFGGPMEFNWQSPGSWNRPTWLNNVVNYVIEWFIHIWFLGQCRNYSCRARRVAHCKKCLSIGNLPWIHLGQLALIMHFSSSSNRPNSTNLYFSSRNPFLNISISFRISQNQPTRLYLIVGTPCSLLITKCCWSVHTGMRRGEDKIDQFTIFVKFVNRSTLYFIWHAYDLHLWSYDLTFGISYMN